MPIVFHATSLAAAKQIESAGFRDACFLGVARGVCVSDRPLDAADGVARHCDVVFEIVCPDEVDLNRYEIVEDGRPAEAYREFLVPARVLNRWSRRRHIETID